MKPRPHSRSRRGFTLIELGLALGIASISLGGVWTLSQTIGKATGVRLMAGQTQAVASAARDYVASKRTTVLALVPALNNVTEITTTTLVTAGLLPSDFVNRNAYGQTYKIYVRREDAGAVGADASDNLVTLVLTTGGMAIPDSMASGLVTALGTAGGFLFADSNPAPPTAATTARGAAGGWSVNLSAAGWSTIGATATAGRIAVLANLLPHSTDGGTLGGGGGGGGGGANSLDELTDVVTDYPNNNIFVGSYAGDSITTGHNNEAFGMYALFSLTTGYENVAVGESTLYSLLDGVNNVAVGHNAMRVLTTGADNTAVGYEALYSNLTGTGSVAVGALALQASREFYNTAIGGIALTTLSDGGDNVALGEAAGENIPNGYENTLVGTDAGSIYHSVLCDPCNTFTAVGGKALANMGAPQYATAVGYKALYEDDGSDNTAVGRWTLSDNVSGAENTAVGVSAGGKNSYNTAAGFQALIFTHSSGYNTAIGRSAARLVNSGGENIAIGESALLASTNADETVVIGVNAADGGGSFTGATIIGDSAMRDGSGSHSTAIGNNALYKTTGNSNLAIGPDAGRNITTGTDNVAIGGAALYQSTVALNSGSNNIGIGRDALAYNTTGHDNVAVGYGAAYSNDTTSWSVAVGYKALVNGLAPYTVAVGSESGLNFAGAQADNVFFGYRAGYGLQDSGLNTIVGAQTMQTTASASDNVCIGYQTMGNATASYATAVGYKALYAVTSSYNAAFGYEAAAAVTSGTENIAIGHEALYKSGTTNTASNNIAIGYQALRGITSGGNNVAVGVQAGVTGTEVTTGTNNTFVGYQAGANANNYTNGTALGNGAILTASNSIVLGNTSIASIYAQVAGITLISDARLKRDIAELPLDARAFLRTLQPQQYRYNNGDDTLRFGFIAQALERALPEPLQALMQKPNGLALILRDSDPDHTYRVNYAELIAPIVKSIQDIDASDAAKEALIQEQDARIARIEARIQALENARRR